MSMKPILVMRPVSELTKVCDKCGGSKDAAGDPFSDGCATLSISINQKIHTGDWGGRKEEVDLCLQCYKKFNEWLEEEEEDV